MSRRLTPRRLLAGLAGFLVIWSAAAILSIPLAFGWIPAALALWLMSRSQTSSIALAAVSVVIAIGLLEGGARLLPASMSSYRPDERFFLARDKHYVPNVNESDFEIAHGDLVAMSGGGAEETAEPRRIRFKTDALGYRNDRDHGGETLVVVGDSFAVGIGTTQDEILSVQLGARLGRSVYNASFPLEPDGYAAVIRRLRDSIGADFKAVVLLFEGNDFECGGRNPSNKNWATYVPADIRRLSAYRLMFGMTHRLQARLMHAGDIGLVRVHAIAGKPVAFYKTYIQQARRAEPCDWSLYEREIKSVAGNIGLLVFIPDKIRVYQPMIAGEPALPASPAFAFVRRIAAEMRVPALDLTAPLQAAASTGAPDGRFVFWRDDTHWNGAGIAVAANAIAETVRRDLVR